MQRSASRSAHVATWVARSLAGATLDGEPDVRFGCDELTGTIVDVHVDTSGEHRAGYWWTLRVAPDRVDRLVQVTGMSTQDWMEWSAETSAATVALADLDGDGRLDVVSVVDSHEGGATTHDLELSVVLARSGKRRTVATFGNDVEAVPGLPSLVVAITGRDRTVYRCIGNDLALGTCPDVATARMPSSPRPTPPTRPRSSSRSTSRSATPRARRRRRRCSPRPAPATRAASRPRRAARTCG
jgi:hypothetical protein